MAKQIINVGVFVRARLQNLSRETGLSFDLILTRYALERLIELMNDYCDIWLLSQSFPFDGDRLAPCDRRDLPLLQ